MTMFLPILCVLGLNAFANYVSGYCTPAPPTVKTTSGPIQGEYLCTVNKNVTYSSFKGIRFGKAPVGNLRFKAPQPADKWTNVLNATSVGAACPQVGVDGSFSGNEDCLFLNVFTPVNNFNQKITKPKAVMVFIYGRLYSQGSGDPSLYGPDFFLENDVVFVTFNYRLSALGFLALDHKDCPGNAGLKDQRLALKWVKENIAHFGGDPSKVTLIGESVGSVSALYHTLSIGSRDLFHQVIAMSGSPLNPWGLQSSSKAQENAFKLGSLLGKNCKSKQELLNHLSKASAKDIEINARKLGFIDPPFRPVVEDPKISPPHSAILTKSPEILYKSGQFSKIPHLLGVMANESLVYARPDSTRSQVIAQAKSYATKTHTQFSIASVYLAALTGKSSSSFIQETTDLLYNSGMEETRRFLKEHSSSSIYYYSISIAPKNCSLHYNYFKISESGAAHGDDIPYLFWVKGLGFPLEEKHPVSIVRARLTRMLTNFAKSGNPTPLGKKDTLLNITWPEHRASGQHLDIGEKLTLKKKTCNANIDTILSTCTCRARIY